MSDEGHLVTDSGVARGRDRVIYALHGEVEILTVRRASQQLRNEEIKAR